MCLFVCVVIMDKTTKFCNLIPAVNSLYTQCNKSESSPSDVNVVFFPWTERQSQKGRERLQAHDESDEHREERDKAG